MTLNKFIFSNQPSHKLSRHLALWLGFTLYFFIANFFPRNIHDLTASKTFIATLQRMIYLPVSVFSVYISIYFLVPRFILKGKIFHFLFFFLCLSLVNFVAAYLLTKVYTYFTQHVPFHTLPIQTRIFLPIMYGLGLGVAASGFAIIIKLLKTRYLKQKENEWLLQQKINTELQMIKTNFHPHFLSNALQNISDLIRSRSPQTPEVIVKLSDLLSYILYESGGHLIKLEQELQMMKDYLNLEKTFYGNRILINMAERGDMTGKIIAPLVLLSLVQNCCEQFLISLQQKLTIDIETTVEDDKIIFHLGCNGYYETINGIPRQNTGLNQALRRIEVIYSVKHKLETHSKNGFFSMTLILEADNSLIIGEREIEDKVLYEFA